MAQYHNYRSHVLKVRAFYSWLNSKLISWVKKLQSLKDNKLSTIYRKSSMILIWNEFQDLPIGVSSTTLATGSIRVQLTLIPWTLCRSICHHSSLLALTRNQLNPKSPTMDTQVNISSTFSPHVKIHFFFNGSRGESAKKAVYA